MQRSRGYKHETAYLLPGVLLTFLWTINPPLRLINSPLKICYSVSCHRYDVDRKRGEFMVTGGIVAAARCSRRR